MFLTYEGQHTMAVDLCGDDATGTLTTLKREINIATGRILHQMGLYIHEGDGTITSVADQQEYELPAKNVRVKSITYTSGDTPYVVQEIADRQEWLELNEITSYSSSWPDFYFIEGNTVKFFPTPSTAGDTITVRQEQRFREMTLDDHTTGTVTMVNGDKTVEGASSPAWTTVTNIRDDCWFKVNTDGMWYEIDSITDADTLELAKAYEGVSGSALAYTIGEQALGPYEDLHVLPVWWALIQYYGAIKEDKRQFDYYAGLWADGWQSVKDTYSKATTSNVIPSKHRNSTRYEPSVYKSPY